MAKDFNKVIATATAAIAALGGAVGVFWESVCPIVDMCPAEAEIAAPGGDTTNINKEVTIDGSSTSNGGDAKSEVTVGDLNL